MSRTRLPDLGRLAEARSDAALANLSKASRERARLQTAIAELKDQVTAARRLGTNALDMAANMQAERFAIWADTQIAALNQALALQNVLWMELREIAARAHGQKSVLADLVKADQHQRALEREKRREKARDIIA